MRLQSVGIVVFLSEPGGLSTALVSVVGCNVLAKTNFHCFHVFYTNIYTVYILNCVKLYFVHRTLYNMEVQPFFVGLFVFPPSPFGTVLYSIRSRCVGSVKPILRQQNVSIVISNSFGEINVLGMVETLT